MVLVKVKKFSRSKTEVQPEIIPDIGDEIIPDIETNSNTSRNEEEVNETFDLPPIDELDDLTNVNFNKKSEKTQAEDILKKVIDKKKETPVESNPGEGLLTKIINRRKEKPQKVQINNESWNDDDATPILGKDRRILTSKIQQYKNLFPEILGKFKLKKNPTVEDLQEALDEMDVIVNCSSVEDFLNDSILQCLKMIEGASSYTRYDVSGMSDLLRQNNFIVSR